MKTHLVISLILSGSMLLAQNVTTSLSQLNQLRTGYSFSLTNSNLKVTLLEDIGEGGDKGDYFTVPLNSVVGELVYTVNESGEGFIYRWSCENEASCIYRFNYRYNKGYERAYGWLDLGMDFEKAKNVAYLMFHISRSFYY